MSADRVARFSALVARQPDNPLFRFSLAQALDAEGRLAEAAAHYRACAAARADWMMPRILLGKARLARPAEARPVLEEALRLAVEQRHEEPEAELRALLA
mgnify:CR=1 FL=1